MQTEMGIRAEANKQTAITALYRKRKFILGFVGGECREASKFVEQALGKRGQEQLTAEFHQVAVQPLANHQGN